MTTGDVKTEDACPGCGYPGGRKACQDVFDDVALRVRALACTGSLITWRLMHDVYAIQHEEEFCGRWRGLIAHLGGVCLALEHGGPERGYRALQKLVERDHLKGQPYPPAPGIPPERGSFTAASPKDPISPCCSSTASIAGPIRGWPTRACSRSRGNGSGGVVNDR
jgi:hypothetical protein